MGPPHRVKATIAIIDGDGVGTEVVPQGVRALRAVAKRFGHDFDLVPAQLGYRAWKQTGVAAPPETIELCKNSDGILLGAIGAGQLDFASEKIPPGWGRRQFSRELAHTCSVRPIKVFPQTVNASPVKAERIRGTDFVVVRDKSLLNNERLELTDTTARGRMARDMPEFHEDEIVPMLKFSFLLARSRRKKLCLVAQASMFATSRLWLQLFLELAKNYPDVEIDVQAPDNCAMQVMRNPALFDVIVSDSTPIGGIINNLGALLMGSIGMPPGATFALRDGGTYPAMVCKNGLYESIHGTADARAGQRIVNPIGTVLAAAMLLRYSLGLEREAKAIEQAVETTLESGYRTYDIMEPDKIKVGTDEMGERIAAAIGTGA